MRSRLALPRCNIATLDPTLADAVVAALLTVVGQIDVWTDIGDMHGHPVGPRVARAVVMLLATAPIAFRRRSPLAAVAVVSAAVTVLTTAFQASYTLAGEVPLLLGTYSVAAHGRDNMRRIIGLCAPISASLAVSATTSRLGFGASFTFSVFLFGLVWAVGWLVRTRAERAQELSELAEALDRERDQRAVAAVAEERARIARELHDVIAHAVTVIIVQAGAGTQTVEEGTPARGAFDSIREAGGQALGELRRLVGILREQGDELSLAPQPGIDEIAALVEQARGAGVKVALSVEGERRRLSPGVELAAFRIVQEALTNFRKHAGPASARVEVCYRARSLELSIVDDGRTANGNRGQVGGHGLLGMRERVAIYGGTLEAGPQPGGGFAVRAALPIERSGT